MEKVNNQKFEKIENNELHIYYWNPIVICDEKKDKESFSFLLERRYIGGSIGYYLCLRFGGKEYSSEVARIRVAGAKNIEDIKAFFRRVVSLYKSESRLGKPSEYIRMFNN